MKLSIDTKTITKSISKIQPGLIIQPGNIIYVRTEDVYVEAAVAETFPIEVRVANLNEFLRTLALFKDPDLVFTEEHIRIVQDTAEVLYPQAEPTSIVQLPRPKVVKPEPPEHISCELSADQWAAVQKALGVGVDIRSSREGRHLVVISDGETIRLEAERGHGKPRYSMIVDGATNGCVCKSSLDASYIPLVPGPYRVVLQRGAARFFHSGQYNFRHFVGLEPRLSTWGGKQYYRVIASKSTTQDCQFDVLACSRYEAEATVRQKPEEEFVWSEQTDTETTLTVI